MQAFFLYWRAERKNFDDQRKLFRASSIINHVNQRKRSLFFLLIAAVRVPRYISSTSKVFLSLEFKDWLKSSTSIYWAWSNIAQLLNETWDIVCEKERKKGSIVHLLFFIFQVKVRFIFFSIELKTEEKKIHVVRLICSAFLLDVLFLFLLRKIAGEITRSTIHV